MLISSSSVLEAVLTKVNALLLRYIMNRGDKLSQKRESILGALFLCLLLAGASFANARVCIEPSKEQLSSMSLVAVQRVVDGDTLRLADGRNVRLIGVNTPEFGRKNKATEPFAEKAKQRLTALIGGTKIGGTKRVRLQAGEETKDRYGRLLAYVFTEQGENVETALVREGLGFAIAIPPNVTYQACLTEVQHEARIAGRGVWGHGYYSPRKSESLKRTDTGFRLVSGRLERAILKEGKAWWLLFEGRLAVMIPTTSQSYFDHRRLKALVGETLVVSGWLIKKKLSAKQKAKKYKPFMMTVKHPASFVDPDLH